jgi:F420-dependent oxidoreductase-like protein
MRLSTRVPNRVPLRESLPQLQAMERAGLELAWVPEAYGFDAATQLGYLAATTGLHLGAGVFSIYSRTPSLLAQTAATLDALTDGRAVLGVGSSGPQVVEGWNGVEFTKPLARTREVIGICRTIWREEEVRWRGNVFEIPRQVEGTPTTKALKIHRPLVRPAIPVFVAALGARNVELTAEIADGWLTVLFAPEFAPGVWGEALAAGRAKRDPALGPLDIVAGGTVAIGEGIEHLRERLRPSLAFLIGGAGSEDDNFYNDLVTRYGFASEAREIRECYLDGRRRDAEAAVPAALLEGTSLIGSRDYLRDRVERYRAAGVTTLDVVPMGPDPARVIGELCDLL